MAWRLAAATRFSAELDQDKAEQALRQAFEEKEGVEKLVQQVQPADAIEEAQVGCSRDPALHDFTQAQLLEDLCAAFLACALVLACAILLGGANVGLGFAVFNTKKYVHARSSIYGCDVAAPAPPVDYCFGYELAVRGYYSMGMTP